MNQFELLKLISKKQNRSEIIKQLRLFKAEYIKSSNLTNAQGIVK